MSNAFWGLCVLFCTSVLRKCLAWISLRLPSWLQPPLIGPLWGGDDVPYPVCSLPSLQGAVAFRFSWLLPQLLGPCQQGCCSASSPQPALMPGVILPWVQSFVLFLLEPDEVSFGPVLGLIRVSVGRSAAARSVNLHMELVLRGCLKCVFQKLVVISVPSFDFLGWESGGSCACHVELCEFRGILYRWCW